MQRYGVAAAMNRHIGPGVGDGEVAQDDLVDERREVGIAQPDVPGDRIELQPERGLQQAERSRGRPRLR